MRRKKISLLGASALIVAAAVLLLMATSRQISTSRLDLVNSSPLPAPAHDVLQAQTAGPQLRVDTDVAPGDGLGVSSGEDSLAARITMNDRELELYVRNQEPWTPDNANFIEKYRGLDSEQLERACKVAKVLHRQEQDAWLPDMIARGEYVLVGSTETIASPEVFGGAWSQRMQPGPDGTRVFTFGHEDHPFVQMRAREIGWLRAMTRGAGVFGD